LIAIDDLGAADEPSLSLMIALAQVSGETRMLIMASAASDTLLRAPLPFGMFARASSEISLSAFSTAETEQLLAAVFGVQGRVNLSLLAERMHRLASGNARNLMLLAQHLADAGLAHYELGAWSLPADVASAELPAGVTELLAARLSALRASSLSLACALALCPELSFSFDECLVLSGHAGRAELVSDLDELVRADVVRCVEDLYTLADRAFVTVLLRDLPEERHKVAYRRLAEVFAQQPNGGFRHGRALWHAGCRVEAIAVFLAENRAVQPDFDDAEALSAIVRSLPADWANICREAVVNCRALGGTRMDEYTLRSGSALLLSIAGNVNIIDTQLSELVTMVVEASPLPEWSQLPAAMPAAERFSQALAAAQARFEATPEPQRLMDPVSAIIHLKDCVRYALGTAAPAYDVATVRALPSFEPFYPFVPALSLIDELRRGVDARLTGRWDEARAIYRAQIELLERVKLSGLDEAAMEYTRLFVLSALIAFEASLGVRCSEEQLAQLDAHPIFSLNARMLRGLLQLWMGDVAEAERTIQAAELLRLRSGAQRVFERVTVIWQLLAYVAFEDSARTKQALAELTPLARNCAGWEPFLVYGQAELQRMQGTPEPALALLSQELTRVRPGDHHAWTLLAAAEVRALDALGQREQAISRGFAQLAAAEPLGPSACQPILLALSVALARAGDQRASALADRALTQVDKLGATGLNRALAHEARAWVALLRNERLRYEEELKRVQAAVNTQPGSAFSAKLQRLKQAAN
jgi:hypothetical protein